MIVNPFTPDIGAGQSVSTGAGSASISLNANSKCVRVVNYGATNGAYVRVGKGAQTATAGDTFIRANSELVIYKNDQDTLAYIQLTGATTLHVQTGDGGS